MSIRQTTDPQDADWLLLRSEFIPEIDAAEQGAFVPMVRTSQAALEMHPEAEVEPELDLRQS